MHKYKTMNFDTVQSVNPRGEEEERGTVRKVRQGREGERGQRRELTEPRSTIIHPMRCGHTHTLYSEHSTLSWLCQSFLSSELSLQCANSHHTSGHCSMTQEQARGRGKPSLTGSVVDALPERAYHRGARGSQSYFESRIMLKRFSHA